MFLSNRFSGTICARSLRIHKSLLSTYSNVVIEMTERGLVSKYTSPDIIRTTDEPTTIYCGVDPTARSLHLGNLVTLMGLLHFHIRGHQTIALVGGATGSIGDPSGRKSERIPLSRDILDENVKGIESQIHRFFENGATYAEKRNFLKNSNHSMTTPKVLNNYNWFNSMTAIDFLSDVGRYARVNTMLGKESVKSRMETTQGISFTEFSYQLLQAYDFWYLYKHHGCRIQLGGNDQWGNITAGIDMIARKRCSESNGNQVEDSMQSKAYGITIPLLLTSNGEKFGKSAGNAIWLDEKMTSVFDLYQTFIRTTDDDVKKYLEMFTLLTKEQIKDIMVEHERLPEKHMAQKALADEATELIHGAMGLRKAQTATQVLFGDSLDNLSGDHIIEAFRNDYNRFKRLPRSEVIGCSIDRLAAKTSAAKSKSDAQKKMKSGGLYFNNQRVSDYKQTVMETDLIDGKVCVLRVGKASYFLIEAI
ncbi:putative tyrosine-tRNA ligase [Mycotypha africana]|uniref:putative tyrosine-tRNA ligase n=1 Tax=Mycotypha africana TaxID=64632 RepID=UPI002301DB72|nr:putative tyrosine-tRNA ligase [Mycotypha africana]KAI8970239.1 putative tyrosine-tRNA ligase [Mycotypha africana]